MKKILLLSLLLWATTASAKDLITTVAMVNNDAITSYQLDQKLAAARATDPRQGDLGPEEQTALRKTLLDSLIEDLLVDQQIRELGLKVSEPELEAAIDDVQKQNKLTREQLITALLAQGMQFSDYRQNLRKEILRYKLVAKEVHSKVEVTMTEVRSYFAAHQADYLAPPTLHLLRLGIPLPKDSTAAQKNELMQQAQVARQQLLAGKPLTEVLAGLGGGAEGGDMGTLVETELNSQLAGMVADLKPGQVSEPAAALDSIHIFQVLERTPARAELTDEISAAIEKILAAQNSEKRFSAWKKELRAAAVIDIRI
jgi:peptidyl-prolyl cis-trans isomerase SurA